MEVRDPRLLREVTARPFDGYALHGRVVVPTAADRLITCLALITALVVAVVMLASRDGRP